VGRSPTSCVGWRIFSNSKVILLQSSPIAMSPGMGEKITPWQAWEASLETSHY
jgi:hypothetical protein